jgi:hypothetical protein
MKSKGSASLYEVLKSASRPGSDPAPAPSSAPESSGPPDGQPTLQERLAAYKAAKLAAAQAPLPAASSSATAIADPTPIPVAVPDPTPTAKPAPAPTQILTPLPAPSAAEPQPDADPRRTSGPGERVLRLTYNTAAFAALIVVGLLFVAYALGVRIGRTRAAEMADAAADRAPAAPGFRAEAAGTPDGSRPPAPPPPSRVFTIHLIEWPTRKSEERLKAADLADQYKKALEKQGIRGVETFKITRSGEERLAMYVDRFKDTGAEPARARLSQLQKIKIANQMPFAQAGFEEVPR